MFKPRSYKSLLVGFFLVLFAIKSALAGNITMIYWGAYDVEESIQWQQFYEAKVAEDMQQRGIVFLDACKDYFGEDWRDEHAKNNPLLRSMILNEDTPKSLPHFSYLRDGNVVFKISGFVHRTWYKEHNDIITKLTTEPVGRK